MAEFWLQIDKLVRELADKCRSLAIEFTKKILQEKERDFVRLKEKYGISLALTVCKYNKDAVVSVPCLYVLVSRSMNEEEIQDLIDKIYQEIGSWASDYRLLVRPLYEDVKTTIDPLIALF